MLRAVQTVVDEGIAEPILIGRREVIERRVRDDGPAHRPRRRRRACSTRRRTIDVFAPLLPGLPAPGRPARRPARGRGAHASAPARTVAAALLLEAGLADAAICGGSGNWWRQMHYVLPIIRKRGRASAGVYALSAA